MIEKQFVLPYLVCDTKEELSSTDAELLEAAHEAARNAYAPYSEFCVGAAVRLDNGIIVKGCNIENAAYPSGLCAERVALFSAQANYPQCHPVSLAITAYSEKMDVNNPVSPCGSCRQVMAEVEKRYNVKIKVITQGNSGKIMLFDGIQTLLPFIFNDLY